MSDLRLEAMHLDPKKLIMEIKNRPAIWNTKCTEYNDRFVKAKQWEELVDMYIGPEANETEKRICHYNLQSKWRNIRDAYNKECRRLESDDDPDSKTLYRHYNLLEFLKPVMSNVRRRPIRINSEGKKTRKPLKMKIPKFMILSNESKQKKKKKNVTAESEKDSTPLITLPPPALDPQPVIEDPDRHFMLSLVPDFKRVPDRLKCIVKVNILKCIIEAQEHSIDFEAEPGPSEERGDNMVVEDVLDVKLENPNASTQSDKNDSSSTSSEL